MPKQTARSATRLRGATVVITGASSGIGRAAALAVAARGATVFALARNAEALDDLVAEIRAAGGQAHAFTCDVADSASVDARSRPAVDDRFSTASGVGAAGSSKPPGEAR